MCRTAHRLRCVLLTIQQKQFFINQSINQCPSPSINYIYLQMGRRFSTLIDEQRYHHNASPQNVTLFDNRNICHLKNHHKLSNKFSMEQNDVVITFVYDKFHVFGVSVGISFRSGKREKLIQLMRC